MHDLFLRLLVTVPSLPLTPASVNSQARWPICLFSFLFRRQGRRLPYYYHFLRDKYLLPVLPIVLYLNKIVP
jgi:hypothetical protein